MMRKYEEEIFSEVLYLHISKLLITGTFHQNMSNYMREQDKSSGKSSLFGVKINRRKKIYSNISNYKK
ncbi:hypothetical protein MSSIT_1611 [Methanosarcina siciliae T4/M]|uniref:Uncharacterized protein n=1 Tax=Methanosarcina siciliae T4/M TaxID=1434120 RepID=A0A0E3P496_9EURY|nr:hypothetical protein MSSIT_1611 [Methanosarcina siciliae T4/M]